MPEELKTTEETVVDEAHETETQEELTLETDSKEQETEEDTAARLAKAEEERDNYKKGMLKWKKIATSETKVEEEKEETEEKTVDVKGEATLAAQEVLYKSNEKSAINRFTDQYPALKDPAKWKEVILHYRPTSGKETAEDVIKDLEAALVLAKHYGGGKVKGEEINLSELGTVSSRGSMASQSKEPEISDSTVQMSERFKVDIEKVKKEDDSKQAVIRM